MENNKQNVKVKIGTSVYNCKIVKSDDSTAGEKLQAFELSNKINITTHWENNEIPRILSSNDQYYKYLLSGSNRQIIKEYNGKVDVENTNLSSKKLESKAYSLGNDLVLYTYVYPIRSQNDDYFDNSKFSSFVSLMINSNPEDMIQLQRYDLRGRPHANEVVRKEKDFSIIACDNIELSLYQKYYSEKANFPHFHFHTANGLDEYAIDLDHLIVYCQDLMLEKNSDLLKYNLGMPFLKMKQNEKVDLNYIKFLSQTFIEIKNSVDIKNKNDTECVKTFYKSIKKLDLGNVLVDNLTCSFIKLNVLKILYNLGITGGGGKSNYNILEDMTSPSLKVDIIDISDGLRETLTKLQLEISSNLTNHNELSLEKNHNQKDSIDFDKGGYEKV